MQGIESLVELLRKVRKGSQMSSSLAYSPVDYAWARGVLLEVVKRIEADGNVQPGRLEDRSAYWLYDDRIERFANLCHIEFAMGIGRGASPEELIALTAKAIEIDFRGPSQIAWSSTIEQKSVEQTSLNAVLRIKREASSHFDAEAYAHEISAIEVNSESLLRLTTVGEALLRFNIQDRMRLLIAIENELSGGTQDPYRLDREQMRSMLDSADGVIFNGAYDKHDGEALGERYPYSLVTLWRMCLFGLVEERSTEDDAGDMIVRAYQRSAMGTKVFRELLESEVTVFHVRARALLADQRNAVQPLATVNPEQYSEGVAAMARMVRHELVNIAISLEHKLGNLFEAVRADEMSAIAENYERSINSLLQRLYNFADSQARIAEVDRLEKSPFDPLHVLQRLAHEMKAQLNGRLHVVLPTSLPTVFGFSDSLEHAVRNLLDNAGRFAPRSGGKIQLTASYALARNVVLIQVDDNGPGVAEADIDRIFELGFSTHPRHLGQGLHWVRGTLRSHFAATILYRQSVNLGGAQFEIQLPARNEVA